MFLAKMMRENRFADDVGYEAVYIVSGEHGLYEKYGFEKIGEVETIYGDVDQLFIRVLTAK